MRCADHLTTQAYFDGEVGAESAAEVERHVAQCADCRALLETLHHTRGAIRNLVINRPPRHMKSLLVSVFWPAWVWISAPGTRLVVRLARALAQHS